MQARGANALLPLAFELSVGSSGPDEATAQALARDTQILQDAVDESLGLYVKTPGEGSQYSSVLLRVPQRLAVRVDGPVGSASGGMAGARIETVAASPRCDLAQVVTRLGALEINSVWVEAGPTLSGALLAAGLVDELVLYYAPCVLGSSARGMFELPLLTSLDERHGLVVDDVARIGDDLRVRARVEGR